MHKRRGGVMEAGDELRKLRDMFQPIYKEEFYKYFNKDGGNNVSI